MYEQDKSYLCRAVCLVHPHKAYKLNSFNNQGYGAGNINVPGSSVTTQQLSIAQAGAAQDGSQDVTLGSLSASAASGSPTTVTLTAANGAAGTTGGILSASSQHSQVTLQQLHDLAQMQNVMRSSTTNGIETAFKSN